MEYYNNLLSNDLENETWKDVLGYETIYSVSNFGRIKNLQRNSILKQWFCGNNQLMVTLCADGNKNKIYVSNIVGITYIGVPDRKNNEVFCHLYNNKKNNSIANISIESKSNSTLLSYHNGVCKDWGIKDVGKKTQFVSKQKYESTNIKTGEKEIFDWQELHDKFGSGVRSILRVLEGKQSFKTAYKRTWKKACFNNA